MISTNAVPSFHADVAKGKLVTAMHKYGQDTPCHAVHDAASIQEIVKKIKWTQPNHSQMSNEHFSDISTELKNHLDPIQNKIADMEKTVNRIADMEKNVNKIENMEKKVNNICEQMKQTVPAHPDHVTLSKESILKFTRDIEAIQTQPLHVLAKNGMLQNATPSVTKSLTNHTSSSSLSNELSKRVAALHC